MNPGKFFRTRVVPDALVLEIIQPVGSLADTNVRRELDEVLADFQESERRHVIVDFCQTAYFGSSLLEGLRLVWNRVHAQQGRMILCNVSPIGREILEVAKFDHLWPIMTDADAALAKLQTP